MPILVGPRVLFLLLYLTPTLQTSKTKPPPQAHWIINTLATSRTLVAGPWEQSGQVQWDHYEGHV